MVLDRCPHCAAAVPSGGQWCGQCFADLRPAPEPVAAEPIAALDPLTATLASVQAAPYAGLPPAPPPAPPTAPPPGERPSGGLPPLTWPCVKCGHRNPAADDNCARCGAGFLAGVEDSELVLPLVGSARRLQRSHKIGIMVGGGVGLMALLLLLMLLIGSVL